MIRTMLIEKESGELRSGGAELIQEWSRGAQILWLDLEDEPADEERALLSGTFGCSQMAIDDAQRKRHPPKLEWFDDHFFMLVKGFSAETNSINFAVVHISFFCGHGFLVTRHREPSPSINRVWASCVEQGYTGVVHPGHLTYRVVRTIIDRYSPIILNLEQRLDELEEEMLQLLTVDLINGHISLVSHRLNNIMKTLTIASVIFLPLTFVAGIYGMNFQNMPELSTTSGYFIVIGVMVSIALSLLYLFKRKGWL